MNNSWLSDCSLVDSQHLLMVQNRLPTGPFTIRPSLLFQRSHLLVPLYTWNISVKVTGISTSTLHPPCVTGNRRQQTLQSVSGCNEPCGSMRWDSAWAFQGRTLSWPELLPFLSYIPPRFLYHLPAAHRGCARSNDNSSPYGQLMHIPHAFHQRYIPPLVYKSLQLFNLSGDNNAINYTEAIPCCQTGAQIREAIFPRSTLRW